MRLALMIVLSFVVTMSFAQDNDKIGEYLDKNFSRFSLRNIIFFERELVEYCQDTTHRKEMEREITRQKQRILEDDDASVKERKTFLNLLYRRVKSVSVKTDGEKQSKAYVLDLLVPFANIDFSVDEDLLKLRFDPKKRGLPFGDEECDKDFSFYIFFLYDPTLYVKVLKTDKISNPTGRMKFPTTCFLEELSNVPLEMKRRTQSELVKILDKYKGSDYEELKNKIKKADLNAKYD